jgi:8-oxo-dGTP diphosphatase
MFQSLTEVPIQERWHGQKYPLQIVAAIICQYKTIENKDSSFLLIRRNSDPYLGMWALVGGKWDFGETLVQAVVREVKEETGLETAFVALKGFVNERLVSEDNAEGCPAHFLIYVCELVVTAGIAREQAEGEVAWFSTAEIDRMRQEGAIIPSDYTMLRQFANASSLPFAEAEMVVDGDGTQTLHQFREKKG